jgi:hypothetical protein
MLMQTRHGHVLFEHDAEFKGEGRITKGEVSVTVAMDALRALVAESLRHKLIAHIDRMKTAELLRRSPS